MRLKESIKSFILPSNIMLFIVCTSFILMTVIFNKSKIQTNNFHYILSIFFYSKTFIFVTFVCFITLLTRFLKNLGFVNLVYKKFINKVQKNKGYPTRSERIILESLFYSGITFDELYHFAQFVSKSSFIAFTENNLIPTQHYILLTRNDSDGYWLSYFRFIHRDPERIKMLYSLISNFIEVLTGDPLYKKELREQAKTDLELRNVDTEKLLIAILNKEDIKQINYICDKYYKMIIEKRVDDAL
jgi:hypothetical protein